MVKKVGVIVPNDNDTVIEDLNLVLRGKLELVQYKMRETNNKGYPENQKQAMEFINDLKKAGLFFKKLDVESIVYGRGFGTYNKSGRALINSILGNYCEKVILPTELLIKKIHDSGTDNISLILPYTSDRAKNDIEMFNEENISIKNNIYLGENQGERIAKIPNKEIYDIIIENKENFESTEYIVLQCTALHTIEIIEKLKPLIKNNIISSNSIIKDYLIYGINI